MKDIIRLSNVARIEEGNRRVLNGVNLTVSEGERVTVCGPPGSGKDALTRLIAGMDRPSTGEVCILDKAVHDMDDKTAARFRSKYIGVVQRDNGFISRMTVLENVALPLVIQGVPRAKRMRMAMEQLKNLGVQHIAHARPSQLTAYEARMAAVARALAAQPKLLLLYEPAAGLSEGDADRAAGMLHAVCRYGDFTVVCLTADETSALCPDRLIRMTRGTIQEDNT